MSDLPASAIAALNNGQKIEAIKIVREERKLGLKEAKDLVDAYIKTQPALAADYEKQTSRPGLLVVCALLIALAVYYFLRHR